MIIMHKISVIVPIYNIEEYLPKCIKSVINQTYNNLQIILVDDGSTDLSGEICDYYEKKDKRIKVIHKKNGGLVSARKVGLKVAEGDFIGFVDGDDYVEPQFYEILLRDILESNADFVHTGYLYEENDDSTTNTRFENGLYEIGKTYGVDLIIKGVLGNGERIEITSSIWSKLFKKEFVKKCYSKVPESQSQGEDLICLCICLLEGKRLYMHKSALYHYVKRQGSIMNNANASFVAEIGKLYICLKKIFVDYGVYEQVSFCLDDYFFRIVLGSIKRIDKYAKCIHFFEMSEINIIKGKKVVIYGAGNVGRDYYAQISKYSTCKIVGWVDKNYDRYHYEYAGVECIENLKDLEFDIILIAVKNKERAEKIRQELEVMGISKERIWWNAPITLV